MRRRQLQSVAGVYSEKKSQIEEYIEQYYGSGVQHIALQTKNIVKTVAALRKNGLEFLKRVLIERKKYGVKNTLYAFQNTDKPERDWGSSKTKRIMRSCDLNKRTPQGISWLNTADAFMANLKATLELDNKEWASGRRELRKKGVQLKGKRSDIEDTIRTKELMEILPLLGDLQSSLSVLLSKGDNYTKTQVDSLNKAQAKIRWGDRLMVTLRKHGN